MVNTFHQLLLMTLGKIELVINYEPEEKDARQLIIFSVKIESMIMIVSPPFAFLFTAQLLVVFFSFFSMFFVQNVSHSSLIRQNSIIIEEP